MEKDTKNPIIRDEKGKFIPGHSAPGPGRPQGSLDFKTKFYKVIDKLAKQNNITPEEVEEQLLLVGYKKAKDGDYSFYRDLHDRLYGKAPQTIDINADITIDDGLTEEQKEALLNLLK